MATWDSADLLSRLRDVTGRPATDAALSDTRGYLYLTEAQRSVAYTIAQHIPHVNYGAPVQLTTSDQQLYTLPGSAEWIGRVMVMRDIRGDVLVEGSYDDVFADYCMEGPNGIRITAGRTWTSTAPYARYMAKPGTLDASNPPTLLPTDARQAVVYVAAALWAARGGYRDPDPYNKEAFAILWGRDGFLADPGLIPAYKGQATGAPDGGPWWRGLGR